MARDAGEIEALIRELVGEGVGRLARAERFVTRPFLRGVDA